MDQKTYNDLIDKLIKYSEAYYKNSISLVSDEQFDKAVASGLSDSQLYKMAGNAVSVSVISAIGRFIKEIDERNKR